MVQRSVLCRSRRELSNEYLLAKFGFDTAENEPCKVCPLSAYRSPRLCFVVLRAAVAECNPFTNEYFAIAIGFVVVAGGYAAGGISGGAFNPKKPLTLASGLGLGG